ncbi:MAG: gliding motility-associated protein GldE [Rikenellaceae bacterium]
MALSWGVIYNGFATDDIVMLLVVMVLLALSALVSGAETAFFSLSRADVDEISQGNSHQGGTVIKLLSEVDLLLATILIINNIVNIAIVIFTADVLDNIFTFTYGEFFFKSVVVTFILLFFGEIAPKVLSQTSPRSFACFAAYPLLFFRRIFYPLSFILVKAGNRISSRTSAEEISLDELADAVDIATPTNEEEKGILSGIINFVNTDVAEVMRPRVDITAISCRESFANVKKIVVKSGFSRIPIYDETLDEIRGVLYVKDLLPHALEESFNWQKLIRKPYFVPEHKKISDLLEEFQSQKVHLAVVVDEYGSTLGLLTLEDIIEEIVGEISDDSDTDEQFYTRIDSNTYIFEGRTHIGDFERVLELKEDTFSDVQGEAETLAGLIIEYKRSFPKVGDKIELHSLVFIVESMGGANGRRVDKIKVILPTHGS